MTYKLKFLPSAFKEWKKLDFTLQKQFKKKIIERLEAPHILSSKLSGFKNYYKIKLKASGYRLVYEVIDNELIVLVIAVGKRENNRIYKTSQKQSDK